MRNFVLGALLVLLGCERHETQGAAGPSAPTAPGPSTSAEAAIAPPSEASPGVATEEAPEREREEAPRVARRRAVRDLTAEPLLVPHLATVREHFDAPKNLALETLALSDARTAALLSDGSKHFILAVDSRGGEASTIAWSKERPLAGTFPGATELALAGGSHGELHLAWFDPTTSSIALRRWRHDGAVEADWMLGKVDACDAITARFWPGQGWIVVASNLGTARAFLLDSGGSLRWKGGVPVDFERGARAPITAVPDGDAVVLVGVGTSWAGGRRAPEHVLATRLDADGETLWDDRVDLGRAPPDAVRVEARLVEPGLVAVAVGPHREARLTPAGAVAPR